MKLGASLRTFLLLMALAGLALGGAIMGASRIMDKGLKNALSSATAEVAHV